MRGPSNGIRYDVPSAGSTICSAISTTSINCNRQLADTTKEGDKGWVSEGNRSTTTQGAQRNVHCLFVCLFGFFFFCFCLARKAMVVAYVKGKPFYDRRCFITCPMKKPPSVIIFASPMAGYPR